MIDKLVSDLNLDHDIRQQTAIISKLMTVVVTRRHKPSKRASREEFVVTIGRPNYENRQRIKRATRQGDNLPIFITRTYR